MKIAACFLMLLLLAACGTSGTYRYVSAVKDVPAGHIIKASDIQTEECNRVFGDDCNPPRNPWSDYATDPSQVIGHTALGNIGTGLLIDFSYISDPPAPEDERGRQRRVRELVSQAMAAFVAKCASAPYVSPKCNLIAH